VEIVCSQKFEFLPGLPILVVDRLAVGDKRKAGALSQGNSRERSSSMAVKDDSKVEMKRRPIAKGAIGSSRKNSSCHRRVLLVDLRVHDASRSKGGNGKIIGEIITVVKRFQIS
jgi:hypothetical protein